MKLSVCILLYLCIQTAWCQTSATVNFTLPSIALLDLNSNSSITLAFQSPAQAGSSIVSPTTNTTKWLNFTSAVAPGVTRRITAQVVSGTIPNGVQLKLETATYTGAGSGSLGTVTSPVYLTTTATTFINNIGGAFTGNGTSNGFNLKYSLEIQNYSLLRNTNTSFTIIYTFIDN
ncbi:hypothetical protein [Emticicia sp. BO119]|uniref:hypothetical protein n=1 Tax=Emticicia sp. BO119 TaxID=2757768 RepID=UPI0015F0C931|nr:hypothetical protein [Emticicia sp. BO119]MBA4851228.1 hypothetical protein [Emticicia sp. BO119]